MQFFRDCESGGAWPFLVRGVNCLLNCDNGRDLCLVTECRGGVRWWVSEQKGTPTREGLEKKRGKHGALCIACPNKRCACAGRLPLLFWRFSGGPLGRTAAKPPRYSFTGTIAHKAPEA